MHQVEQWFEMELRAACPEVMVIWANWEPTDSARPFDHPPFSRHVDGDGNVWVRSIGAGNQGEAEAIPFNRQCQGRFLVVHTRVGPGGFMRPMFDICGPKGEYRKPDRDVIAHLKWCESLTLAEVRKQRQETKDQKAKEAREDGRDAWRETLIDRENAIRGKYQWGYNSAHHPKEHHLDEGKPHDAGLVGRLMRRPGRIHHNVVTER